MEKTAETTLCFANFIHASLRVISEHLIAGNSNKALTATHLTISELENNELFMHLLNKEKEIAKKASGEHDASC